MYNLLKESILRLQPIDEADWAMALPLFHFREVKKGEFILKEGQVCDTIDFIVEGCVRTYVAHEGKDISRQFFFENAFFTEYGSFISRRPSAYNIDALEDCKLLSIRYQDINQLYDRSVSFLKFGKLMAEYTSIFMVQRNVEMVTHSATERYLNLIAERPKVMSRVPLHMIASYLGITPEALSRIRKEVSGHN